MFEAHTQNIIRAGLIVIGALCAAVLWRIIAALKNQRLASFARTAFLMFLGFTIARIFAGVLDNVIGFKIGVFSTIVTYAFNIWILYLFVRLLMKLNEEEFEIHSTDDVPTPNPAWINRERVSYHIDCLFDELKVNIKRVDRLKEKLESPVGSKVSAHITTD